MERVAFDPLGTMAVHTLCNLSHQFPLEMVMMKHPPFSCAQIPTYLTTPILAGFLAGLLAASASGQALQWDTNLGTSGAQGGSGDWDGGNFWWNGSTNQAWVSESDAIFGGIAGTVDGSGISVNDITFNTAGYILAPSGADAGITFVGDLDFPTVTTAADATINHVLHGTVGFGKQGSGRLRIGAANHTLTGSITVNAGELEIADGVRRRWTEVQRRGEADHDRLELGRRSLDRQWNEHGRSGAGRESDHRRREPEQYLQR